MGCILVVDDEPDIRETVKDLLECTFAARVRTADCGLAGLDVLREEPEVSLIISDFRMPGMDGAQFLDEAGKVAPGVPQLLFSAFDLDRAWSPPGARLVRKPFTVDEFLGQVESALESALAAEAYL